MAESVRSNHSFGYEILCRCIYAHELLKEHPSRPQNKVRYPTPPCLMVPIKPNILPARLSEDTSHCPTACRTTLPQAYHTNESRTAQCAQRRISARQQATCSMCGMPGRNDSLSLPCQRPPWSLKTHAPPSPGTPALPAQQLAAGPLPPQGTTAPSHWDRTPTRTPPTGGEGGY